MRVRMGSKMVFKIEMRVESSRFFFNKSIINLHGRFAHEKWGYVPLYFIIYQLS
jgi:hypothetical protein